MNVKLVQGWHWPEFPSLVSTHGNWASLARVHSHSLLPRAGQKTDLVEMYVGEPFMPSWALGLGLQHHQQGETYP